METNDKMIGIIIFFPDVRQQMMIVKLGRKINVANYSFKITSLI